MNNNATGQHFDKLTITLHWVMFGIFVAMYASIEFRVLFAKGSDPREAFKAFHFMLGLLILMMASVRIVHRLRAGTAPAITPPLQNWQTALAKLVQVLLYVLMIGMPILGWLTLSAAGKPIPFFGLELPALIGIDKDLGKQLKGLHESVGQASYWLIGLHISAALVHHYVQHDNTLLRMLPERLRNRMMTRTAGGETRPALDLQTR